MRHVISLVLAVTACSPGTAVPLGDQLTGQGAFQIHAEHVPSPPVVGDATLLLTVRDDQGSAVEGATVEVEPWMPQHGHGAGDVDVVELAGRYEASWQYPMAGYWELTVTVDDGEERDAVVYAVDVF